VFFIFSPYEIDLTKVLRQVKNRRALAPSDIQAAIGSVAPTQVKWDEKGVGFSGNLAVPVVMQVLLEQTKR